MKNIYILLFISFLLMGSFGKNLKKEDLNKHEFNELLINSSVICRKDNFRVSGFIVNNIFVISTYHVFHKEDHDSILDITLSNNLKTRAKVLFIDKENDLFIAFLEKKTIKNTLKLRDLGNLLEDFKEGDFVYGIGSSSVKGDFKLISGIYQKDTLFESKICNFIISNDEISLNGACGSFMVNESLSSFALWRGALVSVKISELSQEEKIIPWKKEFIKYKFLIPKEKVISLFKKYKNVHFK